MRALLISFALAASASAQVVVPDAGPAPVLGLSGLDCTAGVPMPHIGAEGSSMIPLRRFETGAVATAPMPNVCREASPLAVLPEGVRFRTDPLAPGFSDNPSRRLLQGLEPDPLFQRYPVVPRPVFDVDAIRQRLSLPHFEGVWPAPVAPPRDLP